ncbi:MAG: hypothetical protein L6R39_005090, partial [Caloplaca ligustica]
SIPQTRLRLQKRMIGTDDDDSSPDEREAEIPNTSRAMKFDDKGLMKRRRALDDEKKRKRGSIGSLEQGPSGSHS